MYIEMKNQGYYVLRKSKTDYSMFKAKHSFDY